MTRFTLKSLGLVAAMTACATVGCVQTPTTVRGQTPASPVAPGLEGPIIGTAPGYGERPLHKRSHRDFKLFAGAHNPANAANGFFDATDLHNRQRVYEVGGDCDGHGCPACNGGLDCPEGGCPHCGCGCGCGHGCPDHYYTYGYKWPKNLVYPQPVLPAGMVQYPYYTLRGPTDFFMQ